MQLKSSAFDNNATIPIRYTCKGNNINPPLSIHGVPPGATSLALTVHDPDSPNGQFTHWLVWNIAPTTQQIIEGASPSGANEGINDFGEQAYGGPCPHLGEHRYIFTLYALDGLLDIAPNISHSGLIQSMKQHQIASATLVGTFRKQ